MELPMRIALGQFNTLEDEERLQFIKQLGVDDIILNTPALPGETHWKYSDLLAWRTKAEVAGLRLGSIENVPIKFYDKVMLGLPGRDEQIENMATTIRNIGKAEIPIFGYHWVPNSVWRTPGGSVTRGDARVTSFDYESAKDAPLTHDREYTAEEMWDNYTYFIKAIVPVAEEANVNLALHPDDPPVESLGGIARIFRNFEGFKRAIKTVDSERNGLDFCQGCWTEMGEDVYAAIRYFAERGKIFYVHFRNVKGTVPKFEESFINDGDVDMYKAMRIYKESGFNGMMIPDHVPHLVGDPGWGYRSRAHAVGYMQALLDVVNSTS